MRFLVLALCCASAAAQPRSADPDWPCQQLLVPSLAPGSYWNGKLAPDPGWRNDEALFNFVTEVSARNLPEQEAEQKLAAFADAIPKAERTDRYGALFAALTDQINDERSDLIQRLDKLGRRQRAMSRTVADLSTRAEAEGADPALADQRDFATRAYQQLQNTMRYACEAPANLERRLGAFARLLQQRLAG